MDSWKKLVCLLDSWKSRQIITNCSWGKKLYNTYPDERDSKRGSKLNWRRVSQWQKLPPTVCGAESLLRPLQVHLFSQWTPLNESFNLKKNNYSVLEACRDCSIPRSGSLRTLTVGSSLVTSCSHLSEYSKFCQNAQDFTVPRSATTARFSTTVRVSTVERGFTS